MSFFSCFICITDPWRDDPEVSSNEEDGELTDENENEDDEEDEEHEDEEFLSEASCVCGHCKDDDPNMPKKCCLSDPCLCLQDSGN
jgi:hypothetical protein